MLRIKKPWLGTWTVVATLLAFSALAPGAGAAELPPPTIVKKGDVRFGIVRPRASRAPTLIFLATSLENTFNATYGGVARRAGDAGWVVVSIDLPAHGEDRRPDEIPNAELWAWRARTERGEDILRRFTRQVSAVITLLIRSGEADPARIFIGGISRGGYMALHAAAADSRIAGVVGLIPVTELTALIEFKGFPAAKRANAAVVAPALAGRPIWITIGTNDDRVGTAACVRFAQAVVAAAARKHVRNRLELHVREANAHSYPPDAEDQAAAWLRNIAAGIH